MSLSHTIFEINGDFSRRLLIFSPSPYVAYSLLTRPIQTSLSRCSASSSWLSLSSSVVFSWSAASAFSRSAFMFCSFNSSSADYTQSTEENILILLERDVSVLHCQRPEVTAQQLLLHRSVLSKFISCQSSMLWNHLLGIMNGLDHKNTHILG